jgi:hypothetical protein
VSSRDSTRSTLPRSTVTPKFSPGPDQFQEGS